MSSCVLRIRPATQTQAGRSIEQSQAIVQSVAPGAAPSGLDVEFGIDVPLAFSELEGLAQVLVEGASEEDIVLIEADFPTRESPRSYQVLDSLVTSLVAQEPILRSKCGIAVVVQELPNHVDQMYDLLAVPSLAGRLTIVDGGASHMGDADLARSLLRGLASNPAPDDAVERSILRHRGVFRSSGTRRVSNYLFYYEALPKASSYFQRRLVAALNQLRPEVVIIDTSTSGPWFASMVQAACVEFQMTHSVAVATIEVAQLLSLQEGRLPEPENSRAAGADAILAKTDSRVAVVVPAYASGRSLTRALEVIGSPALDRCTAIAVFADTGAKLNASAYPGFQGVAHQPYAGRTLEVQCMCQVELRTLERGDWLVAAAEALGEVRELPMGDVDHGKLGRAALWSLYADCGVSIERLPAGGRAPKRFFPDFARLNEWDAHWLAEAAVRNILDRIPRSNRDGLLVVIPAEENGTRPLARALIEKCRAAVLPIPRAAIDGDEDLDEGTVKRLQDHTADTIAVLDESTVTHGTLKRLADLVEQTVRVRPDLVGAVIDMSEQTPDLDIPYFSLTAWAALAEAGPS